MVLTICNQGFGVVREKRTVDLSGKWERAVEPQGQRHPRAHEFDHTPKDETIRLHIGDAFESRLWNHKASDRYDKQDANTLHFRVKVGKSSEAVIRYGVLYT